MCCIRIFYQITTMTLLLSSVNRSVFRTFGPLCAQNLRSSKSEIGANCGLGTLCIKKLVCGSNLVTYVSYREFKRAKKFNPNLKILHTGDCGEHTTHHTSTELIDTLKSVKTTELPSSGLDLTTKQTTVPQFTAFNKTSERRPEKLRIFIGINDMFKNVKAEAQSSSNLNLLSNKTTVQLSIGLKEMMLKSIKLPTNPPKRLYDIAVRNMDRITELDDIFISVKTTKRNEDTRLVLILKTWFQLAKHQTWFFTDGNPTDVNVYNETFTNQHIINTNCSDSHEYRDLCCKTSVEFDYYIKSGKRWFCHFDDDNYVNIPRLVDVLQAYDHNRDWYFGRRSMGHAWVFRHYFQKQIYKITFGTFGAGTCISKSAALKIYAYFLVTGYNFANICNGVQQNDDVTFGFLIAQLTGQSVIEITGFHSHYEKMKDIPAETFRDQISFSYEAGNVVNIGGFDTDVDPTRFLSLHCYLFPFFSYCLKLIQMKQLLLKPL